MLISFALELIHIIGTPYLDGLSSSDPREDPKLFDVAFKNRVELLYLEKLKESGRLHRLAEKYDNLIVRHRETLVTVQRVAELLNSKVVPYIIIKTFRPYPAVPNDVDVLFMGSNREYPNAIEVMKQAGYVLFEMAPGQGLFCDPRGAHQMRTDKKGGMYYLDLYRELSVQYFTFMDKERLKAHIITRKLNNSLRVNVLKPEIELALLLMHSVFPSQRYEIEMFYTILYNFSKMDSESVELFVKFVEDNHIIFPVVVMLEMTGGLHSLVFGRAAPLIDSILARFGSNTGEFQRFMKHSCELPHEFAFQTFFRTFYNRLRDPRSLLSLRHQILHLFDPRFAVSFLLDFIKPSLRERRHRHV